MISEPGRETKHSFAFGGHYDPANLGFGPLICHFDDALAPGGGYPMHGHADLEIVSWVLDGVLTHTDSTGARVEVPAGAAQVMSAGAGIRHSELADGPTRFVQMWLRPDSSGGAPRHNVVPVEAASEWVPIASGSRGDALARIGTAGATLYAAQVGPGGELPLPGEALTHLYVPTGSVQLTDGGPALGAGDAVRLRGSAGVRVRAEAETVLLAWGFSSVAKSRPRPS